MSLHKAFAHYGIIYLRHDGIFAQQVYDDHRNKHLFLFGKNRYSPAGKEEITIYEYLEER